MGYTQNIRIEIEIEIKIYANESSCNRQIRRPSYQSLGGKIDEAFDR